MINLETDSWALDLLKTPPLYRSRRSLCSLSRDSVYDISLPWLIRLKPKDNLEVIVGTSATNTNVTLAVITPLYPRLSQSYL